MTDIIIWSAWVGGLAVGLYAIAQFVVTGQHLGASTGLGNVCGLVSRDPFFHTGSYKKNNNWRLWFTLGIPLGGLLAVLTSGSSLELSFTMGTLYDSVLPSAWWAKAAILTGGGVLLGFGARMAGGCTSGHGIFGISLLNRPSILATMLFFVGGVVAVQLVFGLLG
jgi:uncharacterized membrane protein YedE/YeeE